MASLLFDTHKAVKDLQEAGFDEAQAEAVVSTLGTAIVGNVATKQDVNDIRSEIQDIRANVATKQDVNDIRSEIQDIRANAATKQDVNDIRSEIQDIRANAATKQEVSSLRSEMHAMELRITLRMGGLIAAGVALIIALDKLL